MKIELKEISVRELAEGYEDNPQDGSVVGYGRRLDIRPPYQREFIYKEAQRNAVIDTVYKRFPLNVMYWAVRNDGTFEVIDGQQRAISICQYVMGDYSVKIDGNLLAFHNLQDDQQRRILDYRLMVYVCSGTDSEKLEWFRTINIAGEELTLQELRNAVFHGAWVSDAKTFFSKNGCVASRIGSDYLVGSPIRQDYLETAIRWISKGEIEAYMSRHQQDVNANEIKAYFRNVIDWVNDTFKPSKSRKKIIKGVDWGALYDEFKDCKYDAKMIDDEVSKLLLDDDVTRKTGIYPYILTRKEKYLSIRGFTESQILCTYERQKGVCPSCGVYFELAQMEADHITPWHAGGKTAIGNCQMLCRECNRRKSGK